MSETKLNRKLRRKQASKKHQGPTYGLPRHHPKEIGFGNSRFLMKPSVRGEATCKQSETA